MKKIFFAVIFIIISSNTLKASDLFTTWEGLEVDKLASVWLIKRFISPDAEITFYPKNHVITHGIQFDTPFGAFKRKFNHSSFESLMVHYQLSDPVLSRIALLIHDIEINVWEKKKYEKTREIDFFFISLLTEKYSRDKVINQAEIFFNRLYDEMSHFN